jgi:hypothetical protein
MSSITIHKMDEHLARELRRKAKSEKISVNAMVKQLLSEALGIKVSPEPSHKNDFASFAGIWSEKDVKEFEVNTADMNSVNPEEWR